MSQSEIADAARLIRPILTSQLSLCRAVYAPTDHMAETERIERALSTFDRMVAAMYAQPVTEQLPPAVVEDAAG